MSDAQAAGPIDHAAFSQAAQLKRPIQPGGRGGPLQPCTH